MKFLLLSQSVEGGCGRGAPRAHPGCFCARRPPPLPWRGFRGPAEFAKEEGPVPPPGGLLEECQSWWRTPVLGTRRPGEEGPPGSQGR